MDIYNPHTKEIATSAILEKEEQVIFATNQDDTVITWLQAHSLHASLIEDIQSEEQSITFDEIEDSKLKVMKCLMPNEEDSRGPLNILCQLPKVTSIYSSKYSSSLPSKKIAN